MGKYTDRLNEYVNTHAVSIVSANPINGGSNLQHPSTDTVNTDTVVHAVSIVSDVSNTIPHAVSIDGVSSTPLRLNKYTDGLKAADAFKYVACVNCANLKKGYCSAWLYKPEVPEFPIRLCNKYIEV